MQTSKAYQEGEQAYVFGASIAENPYADVIGAVWYEWLDGYYAAQDAAEVVTDDDYEVDDEEKYIDERQIQNWPVPYFEFV